MLDGLVSISRRGVLPVEPEPACDIEAQIESMLDDRSPRTSVFIANGTVLPADLPANVITVPRPFGTLLTISDECAARFIDASTDKDVGSILGLPFTKEEALRGYPVSVQVIDRQGRIVIECIAPKYGVTEAKKAFEAHALDGAEIVDCSPLEMIARRRKRVTNKEYVSG